MKKVLFLSFLILSLSLLTHSARADLFQWSFDPLPTDGNISGPPGSTIGWGYTISNLDDTDWLVLTGISADPFEYGSADSSIFDFPIIAPNVTLSVSYDGTTGLYALTWDDSAPMGFVNIGTFTLSAEWWDGDPSTPSNAMLIQIAEEKSQPYSATVVAAVPEPTTLLLLSSGLLSLLGFRRRHNPIDQL